MILAKEYEGLGLSALQVARLLGQPVVDLIDAISSPVGLLAFSKRFVSQAEDDRVAATSCHTLATSSRLPCHILTQDGDLHQSLTPSVC